MTQEKKSSQSFFNNGAISNSQFMQGNNNQMTNNIGNNGPENTLTPQEVLNMIAEMNKLVHVSELPAEPKNKCLRHLKTVEDEVREEEPDKKFAAKRIKKVFDILKETGKIINVADKIEPVLSSMLPWLGVEKDFFVL